MPEEVKELEGFYRKTSLLSGFQELSTIKALSEKAYFSLLSFSIASPNCLGISCLPSSRP